MNENLLADALSSLLRAVQTFPPDGADAQRAYRFPIKEAQNALSRHRFGKSDEDDPTEADTDLELQAA